MPKPALTYLTRRGHLYWFRMAVPLDLVNRLGREIKLSLRTCSLRVARLRCLSIGGASLQLFAWIRSMPELDHETIKRLAREYFQQQLRTTEELAYLIPQDSAVDRSFESQNSLDEAERLRKALAQRRYDAVTRGVAAEVLSSIGLNAKGLSLEDFDQLCVALLRARIEAHRIYAAKLRGCYDEVAPRDPLFTGLDSASMPNAPGLPDKLSDRSIPILIDKFLELKGAGWVPKTRLDNKTILTLFAEVVGPTRNVETLGKEELRAFRDVLYRLPTNYPKRKASSGQPVHAIIKANQGPTISRPTIAKYLTRTYAFLDWCVEEGYLSSPLPRVKVPSISAIEAQQARFPFSKDQLRLLFSSPVYAGCKSPVRRTQKGAQIIRDGKYWIPLIALYSGLRLGEIVQLLVRDIKSEEGVIFFDIRRGEGETKQIKTASSVRRVPVHETLIDLGFLDYVASARANRPKGRLFEDVEPGANGDFSHNFSKWFGRYATAIGMKTPKTAFHSFRHSFKDALVAASVPESHARALMGHATDGVHGLYGTGIPLKLLNAELQKATYPLDLSLLTKPDAS